VIVHDDVPQLDGRETATYLNVLSNCIEDWKPGEQHELIAVFRDGEKIWASHGRGA